MTRKELSAVVAECAARTERAMVRTEEARAGIDVVRLKQEEAIAEQQKAVAEQRKAVAEQQKAIAEQQKVVAEQRALGMKLEKHRAEADARWEEERAEFRDWFRESKQNTDKILAELQDGRDERRAMLEALFRVMDRLPPPPPNLRSA